MSPLPKGLTGGSNNSDVDEGGKTSAFNAKTHASFICRTFAQYYDTVDFDKWCVTQVCNDANRNCCIAQLLDIKHVRCKSHQLALDVKDIFKEDNEAATLVEDIHATMTLKVKNLKCSCISKLK